MNSTLIEIFTLIGEMFIGYVIGKIIERIINREKNKK